MLNNTKVKTTAMNVQQYKIKNTPVNIDDNITHDNACSTIQK